MIGCPCRTSGGLRRGTFEVVRADVAQDGITTFPVVPTLDEIEDGHARFVAFTNNRAERDLRMSKVKQKVSGCFRTRKYAQAYCRISSYLQSMAYQGYNPLVVIQIALAGRAVDNMPKQLPYNKLIDRDKVFAMLLSLGTPINIADFKLWRGSSEAAGETAGGEIGFPRRRSRRGRTRFGGRSQIPVPRGREAARPACPVQTLLTSPPSRGNSPPAPRGGTR